MSIQPISDQQRLAIFQNNKHIQFLYQKYQNAVDAYDVDETPANLEALKTAQRVYNLMVKELNDRIDNGYTY